MKRFLFVLAITAMMNCAAQPKVSDSVTISTVALKRILTAAEQKKVLDGQVVILNDRINLLQAIIDKQGEKDSVTVESYEQQLKVMREERTIFQDQIKTFEKLLRREKRKRMLTGAAGLISTGIVIYLATK